MSGPGSVCGLVPCGAFGLLGFWSLALSLSFSVWWGSGCLVLLVGVSFFWGLVSVGFAGLLALKVLWGDIPGVVFLFPRLSCVFLGL